MVESTNLKTEKNGGDRVDLIFGSLILELARKLLYPIVLSLSQNKSVHRDYVY